MQRSRSRSPKKKGNLSREEILLAQSKQKKFDSQALKIVEQLLEPDIDHEWLLKNLKNISRCHMEDVIEERAISKLCGYILCSNPLTETIKQQYRICLRSKKVYDVSKRKNFCSSNCYGASNYLLEQMLTSPLWAREKEKIPNFTILNKNDNLIINHDEISFNNNSSTNDAEENNVTYSETLEEQATGNLEQFVLEALKNIDKNDDNKHSATEDVSAENNTTSENKSLNDEKNKINRAENFSNDIQANDELASKRNNNTKKKRVHFAEPINDFQDNESSDDEVLEQHVYFTDDQTQKEENQKQNQIATKIESQNDVINNDSDDDLVEQTIYAVNNNSDDVVQNDHHLHTSSDKNDLESSLQNENTLESESDYYDNEEQIHIGESSDNDTIGQTSEDDENVIYEESTDMYEKILSSFDTPPSKDKENLKTSNDFDSHCSPSVEANKLVTQEMNNSCNLEAQLASKIKKDSVTDEIANNNDENNPNNKSINTVNDEKIIVDQLLTKKKDKINQTKTKKKKKRSELDATFTSSLAKRVEISFHEWVQEETKNFLFGDESIKQKAIEMIERQEKYSILCKKLNKLQFDDELEDEKCLAKPNLKPAPHYSILKEEGQKIDIKVRAFYQGKLTFDEYEPSPSEETVEDTNTFVPLTEAHAPQALRRKIFCEKLDHILPELLRTLGGNSEASIRTSLKYTSAKSKIVKALVHTFALSAKNIIFKTAEWTLVGLIIIKMISLLDSWLLKFLSTQQAKMYLTMILTSYQLEANYLTYFVNSLNTR
ncbi:putative RNA polymerase II subunit B1 CTD phosphatase RPAP2 [Trichogramma pretiosum]|uniref:putative RNA polymerase II subunit B1 CTD phosphatase RPAP2 n=1 Tax=Trichogramma pretiosum TaxID=7493 RepID=UPI0006C9CCC6|nr:putative RNA polymerase II subunit B1 CTD phosphatase RPAP2 [Trichogramma pretiosum]XP_023317066.1 putative RNA polymerase II subunit B1 CTD phosphatase RPAP2 [Trichogramma pretiosum]XP_023317067.1 putative RNA polymerase II subunit B1 CTD phosphatase RPAP2 [Trichogramma pretiosum]